MGQRVSRDSDAAPARGGRADGGSLRCPGPAGTVSFAGHDRSADGQHRMVDLAPDCVRIDRRVAGVAMRIAVPTRAYRGVALSLDVGAGGVPRYRIDLLHRDTDLTVPLGHGGDEVEMVADWRGWSRFFGVSALVERHPGLLEPADRLLGGLRIGEAGALRRKPRFRSKRRPQFLARRRPGDIGRTIVCHGGEREIIART